jgi:hypothetical protein
MYRAGRGAFSWRPANRYSSWSAKFVDLLLGQNAVLQPTAQRCDPDLIELHHHLPAMPPGCGDPIG